MLGVSRPVAFLVLALVPALLVPAVLIPSQVQAADAAPVSMPSKPKGLVAPKAAPKTLDAVPLYQPQNMCNPVETPGITKLKELVLSTYEIGGAGNTVRTCIEGVSEHADGRAWDWMVNVKNPKEKAAAADFLAWVTRNGGENARRLGIQYVIYNQKIWGAYRAKDGWRKSYGHEDHVHVSMTWNGARGNVSFWTGKTFATDYGPCVRFSGTPARIIGSPRTGACPNTSSLLKRTDLPQRVYGHRGSPAVEDAQRALGLRATGNFDAGTWSAVKKFQQAHDIPVTGALDQPTYAALIPSAVTYNRLKGYTQKKAVVAARKHGFKTIRSNDVGVSVILLQTAFRMAPADRNGYFGAKTVARVKDFQQRRGLKVTGVITQTDWDTIEEVLR